MPLINNVSLLNERITFQEKKNVMVQGQAISKWVEVGSCWSYLKTRMLNDIKTTAGTVYQDTINFVVRYDLPFKIKKGMRIAWKSKNYEVYKINLDTGMKEYNVIIAKEL